MVNNPSTQKLSKLSIPNDLTYLHLAINFVLENASLMGFNEKKSKEQMRIEKIRRQKRKRSKRAKDKVLDDKRKRSVTKSLRGSVHVERE